MTTCSVHSVGEQGLGQSRRHKMVSPVQKRYGPRWARRQATRSAWSCEPSLGWGLVECRLAYQGGGATNAH